jgi:hypothetical protein
VVLAPAEIGVFHLAVGGGFVLWDGEAVRRIPTTGGTPETFAAGQRALFVSTDGTNVFWCDSGSVLQKRLDALGDTPLTLYQLPAGDFYDSVSGLAINATDVFFALTSSSLWAGDTERVAKGGGNPVRVGGADPATILAADDTYLYTTGNVLTVAWPIDGTVETAIDSQAAVDIAVDPTHVYWGTPDMIKRAQMPAGQAQFIATETATLASIAVDATNVYWSTAAGHIRRAPKEGGAVETLVAGQSSPRGLELDETALYWANHGTQAQYPSSILKLAK